MGEYLLLTCPHGKINNESTAAADPKSLKDGCKCRYEKIKPKIHFSSLQYHSHARKEDESGENFFEPMSIYPSEQQSTDYTSDNGRQKEGRGILQIEIAVERVYDG